MRLELDRRLRPLAFAGITCVFSMGSVAACVGDSPEASPPDDTTDSGTSSGAQPSSSSGTTPSGDSGPLRECTRNDECPTGFCTDGVCCASPCNGQCESCNEPDTRGQCVPTQGAPRGNRPACAGAGDAVCGGACDGVDRTVCKYPTTECRAGSCADGVLTKAASCQEGACPAVSTQACGDTPNSKYCSASACVGVQQVVTGYDFSCALMTDGTVRCWGSNDFGQLGIGDDDTAHNRPVAVPNLSNVVKLTANSSEGYRVCALLGDQTAKCWGNGRYGTLGDGNTADHISGTPVAVMKDASTVFGGIKDIATGQNATCALDTSGVAWCWGHRYFGTVGDGVTSDTSRQYPVAVTGGGTGNSAITVGQWHACLTTTSNNTSGVRCWGDNSGLGVGMSGQPSYNTAQTTPANNVNGGVPNPIGAGSPQNVTCAILNNSTLGCWGGNARGQLGQNTIGSGSNSATAQSVCRDNGGPCAKMNGVTSFGMGEQFSCAVTSGDVRCWGRDNNYGSLGDGIKRPTSSPVLNASVGPAFPVNATGVAVGAYHACALLADGTVRCWGWGTSGQLGGGNNNDSAEPVAVQF